MTAADQIRAFAREHCSVDEIAAFLRIQKQYVRLVLRREVDERRVHRPTHQPIARAFCAWLRAA